MGPRAGMDDAEKKKKYLYPCWELNTNSKPIQPVFYMKIIMATTKTIAKTEDEEQEEKSPDNDGMNTEFLKYAPVEIKTRYLNIIYVGKHAKNPRCTYKRGNLHYLKKK
jgi:hypothetical protein